MEQLILEHEGAFRLSVFAALFVAMASWEVLAPRRVRLYRLTRRWLANFGLLLIDIVVLRLLFPAAAVGVATLAQTNGWGLFNTFDAPLPLVVLVSVVLLDMAIYFQHLISHLVPVFWRLHRVHHADGDFDFSTALRFHPVEILLSMVYKSVLILALGPPLLAVIIFEIVLNGTAMFNHGNVRMPAWLDSLLRRLIVTPDMHRVHHSIDNLETNKNFGFNLAIWDRLFGTYQAQPKAGHEAMTIGMPLNKGYSTCVDLPAMLTLPFRTPNADESLPELSQETDNK